MFNKKITAEIETKQKEMFQMLLDIFTPGAAVEEIDSKTSQNQWECAHKNAYTVTSMLSRHECTVKEGQKVLFEIYLDNDYLIATRGMYLKHLKIPEPIIETVRSSLTYHENYDMKHLFVVGADDAAVICRLFITRDDQYDNGLIKPGEIENSKKRENGGGV